tara:strand:+ start:667 stop:2505 length:1839 start_codon:yes stop_codon:yes gene_type:complete
MFRWFEKLIDPYADYDEDSVPPNRVVPFIWNYLRNFKNILISALFFSALVSAIEIFLIFYSGYLIDLMVNTNPKYFFSEHAFELMLIAGFVLIINPLLGMIDRILMNQTIIPNIGSMVRWRAHRHVLRQSVGWFQNDFAGRIANRLMQTPPAIGAVIYQFFDALTYSIVYIIAAIVLLSDVDFRLTIPLLIWLFAYLTLSYIFIPKVGEASQISSDARSSITGRVVDSYTNIQSVKLFAHHDKEEKYAKEAIEYTRQKFFIEMRLYSWMALGINFINGALLFSVIGWSIYLWSIGSTTIGVVAATTALALRLASMSDWLMWAFTTLFQELGVISEGMETIAQEIDLQDEKNASKLVIKDGSIDIKNIWHHYGKSTGGLNGISLKINGGEKVGIVGRSGAGKSSLVNLILRFHELETGTISIDSQNIKTVTQNSLRANIGMVTQDSSLLHRSVRDNILYGKPEASEEQIIAAAKQAEAWEFIPDLQDTEDRSGLDAQVGERGVKLSGGQRQRISIARVIIKDAPILILDEATSALDSEVEAAIQDTLNGLMHGKTVIAIAHRLSTIAQMDRIIVLEDGKIAEEGSHKKLLDQKGLYYAFWKRQSGGFIGIDVP